LAVDQPRHQSPRFADLLAPEKLVCEAPAGVCEFISRQKLLEIPASIRYGLCIKLKCQRAVQPPMISGMGGGGVVCTHNSLGPRQIFTGTAFTLVELLVVIAILGLLAALVMPALTKAKKQAWTITCLNNLKQLQLCWHMYAHDNNDVIPPNNFVYTVSIGTSNSPTLGEDGLTWCRGIAPLDTNEINAVTSLLFVYNQNAAIYHCPADRSTIDGFPRMLRRRSYNVSNSANCSRDNHFRSSYEIPDPASLFTFIDTDESDIWDSTFGTLPVGCYWENYWLDVPADRHNQGCNLTFADGHAEHWIWAAPKKDHYLGDLAFDENDLQDLRRVQLHIKDAGSN
jgi:prepilin-type processing-associated H-X9-DG protein/prepilin-type N-terminal cleavage/methylation domain-containing protein